MIKIESTKENLKYLAAWIVLLMHAAGMIPALMNPHEEIQGNGTEQMAISEDGQAVYRLADQIIIRTGRVEEAPQSDTSIPAKNPYGRFIPRPNAAAISA